MEKFYYSQDFAYFMKVIIVLANFDFEKNSKYLVEFDTLNLYLHSIIFKVTGIIEVMA